MAARWPLCVDTGFCVQRRHALRDNHLTGCKTQLGVSPLKHFSNMAQHIKSHQQIDTLVIKLHIDNDYNKCTVVACRQTYLPVQQNMYFHKLMKPVSVWIRTSTTNQASPQHKLPQCKTCTLVCHDNTITCSQCCYLIGGFRQT